MNTNVTETKDTPKTYIHNTELALNSKLSRLKSYRKEFIEGCLTTKYKVLTMLVTDYAGDLFGSTDEFYSLEILAKSMINEFRFMLRHKDCADFILE